MRIGNYCEYRGHTFNYSVDIDGEIYISTKDKVLIDDSFDGPNKRGIYQKKVTKADLDAIYRVENYVVIDGREFDVLKLDDRGVLLGTNDASTAELLEFERSDRYYYEKWIDANEVEIKERILEWNMEE